MYYGKNLKCYKCEKEIVFGEEFAAHVKSASSSRKIYCLECYDKLWI